MLRNKRFKGDSAVHSLLLQLGVTVDGHGDDSGKIHTGEAYDSLAVVESWRGEKREEQGQFTFVKRH